MPLGEVLSACFAHSFIHAVVTSLECCSCLLCMLLAHPLSAVISDSPAHFLWHFCHPANLCEQSIGKHENGFCVMCNSRLCDWLYLLTWSVTRTKWVHLYVDLYSALLHLEIMQMHEMSFKKKSSFLCADSQWSVTGLDFPGEHESQNCHTNTRQWECQQCSPLEKWNVDRHNVYFVSVCRPLALFIN